MYDMQVFINDTPAICAEGTNITELLAHEGIQPVNIAVAVNECVIPKAQWDTTVLADGARIIIIKAVQGG